MLVKKEYKSRRSYIDAMSTKKGIYKILKNPLFVKKIVIFEITVVYILPP